ncbi:hypothetical protein [Sphingomonas mucosissima]|uniref:Flagellar FliJ protein n=1 Tax=Sphingomonas mucosissima TaxID=370959 RepID=A0A245ZRH6_9SPHN|nr:hypothetical protein [Sphingomonas mucosissima]OWK32339.1 hypothetical protein SPMU_06620 [Sphingomonas mucosissima]
MDLPNPIPPHLERGIRRARQIEHDVVARLDKMRATAEQRDVQGQLTKAAKDARQALQNPDLSTTSLGVALKGMAKVRAQLMDEAEQADIALVRAAAAYEEAQVALQWHEMRRGLFEERAQSTKSRKRELSADQVSPEEMAFLLEMRARGVPTSALD